LRRFTVLAVILAFVAVAALFVRVVLVARDFPAVMAAERFEAVRDNPTTLRAFLARMPKGSDLHVHLSGAVYAEQLIAWARQDRLCVRLSDFSIVDPPCRSSEGTLPIVETLNNQALFDRIVDALSVRFYRPMPGAPSGHDQFFATFNRFGRASGHSVEMTAAMLRHYQAQNVQYTELMMTFLPGEVRQRLAKTIEGQTDYTAMLATLRANGLDKEVDRMRAQIATQVAGVEAALACDPARTLPGCGVRYRYIAQISRNTSIEEVFVQTAAAAALVRAEPWVVALNLVQTEDHQIARRDYSEHMRIVAFLANDIPVALHAGELWLGLVPPEDLTFHITAAVMTAGARRIGHGTALAFELGMDGLLAALRRRNVAIEISLTSSDLILGVRGKDHPLPTYLAAGVPVVLSTDDPGVSRIDLTNEYMRAAREHGLGYRTLKAIARNGIAYSFLGDEDKRELLARYDRASSDFERELDGRRRGLRALPALIRAAIWPPS
jgi:adenosine deaminase